MPQSKYRNANLFPLSLENLLIVQITSIIVFLLSPEKKKEYHDTAFKHLVEEK